MNPDLSQSGIVFVVVRDVHCAGDVDSEIVGVAASEDTAARMCESWEDHIDTRSVGYEKWSVNP